LCICFRFGKESKGVRPLLTQISLLHFLGSNPDYTRTSFLLQNIRNSSGAHPASYSMTCQGMKLTIHFCLMPRLGMGGAIGLSLLTLIHSLCQQGKLYLLIQLSLFLRMTYLVSLTFINVTHIRSSKERLLKNKIF
jgi:hypothetical protein